MRAVYDIDFAALDAEGKVSFVDSLANQAEVSFAAKPLPVHLLAQALIFTRWWNSYRHMAPEEDAPEILQTALDMLWDYLEGKCTPETLARFQKSFSAAALEIMTGDDSELEEDPESDAFYKAHFGQWPTSYNVYFCNLCAVLEEAVYEEITWDMVQDVLYGDIGDTMIDFFETVYTNPTGGYRPSELDRRDREIYSTPTFCRTVALLQQDMRTALTGQSPAQLRAQYRGEYLFSPEESAKISAMR